MLRFKIVFALLLVLLGAGCSTAQTVSKPNVLSDYIKVWGFLKYNHPNVVGGKVNWDSVFTSSILTVEKEPLASAVDRLIASAGGEKSFGNSSSKVVDSVITLADFRWIDQIPISNESRRILHVVRSNQVSADSKYVSSTFGSGNPDFSSESLADSQDYPSPELRLLAVARYWNAIEYFCPNLNLIPSWADTLSKYLPLAANAKDARQYQGAMLEFCCSICDAHSFTSSRLLDSATGSFVLPIAIMQSGHSYLFRKSRIKIDLPFEPGDSLTAVDGEPISMIIARYASQVPHSNPASLVRNVVGRILGRHSADSVQIQFCREGRAMHALVKPLNSAQIAKIPRVDTGATAWRLLRNNIGYVNLDLLEARQVSEMMKYMSATKTIVFDLRNYPKGVAWDLAPMLGTGGPWARFSRPNYSQPGSFVYDRNYKVKHPKGIYGGKIIVLVNSQTQSQAEYTAMMFRTVPGTIIIGSQTAGADGNISTLPLPGGIKTTFSGLGVYYLDGQPTQQVGIMPDIEVIPTCAGLRAGTDEVLERALKLAESQ